MIRRIGEDQVVRLTDLLEEFEGVRPVTLGPDLKPTGREILCQNVGRGLIRLDEIDPRRAAAQGLYPDRSGSGEQIEHPRVHDPVSQNREDGLLHLVRGRTGLRPAGTFQPPSFRFPRNHAHEPIMEDAGWGRQAGAGVGFKLLTVEGFSRRMNSKKSRCCGGSACLLKISLKQVNT